MAKKLYLCCAAAIIILMCSSWGFFAHKRINHMAVYTLPAGMIGFYKANIDFITDHAVDPDKRRYADSAEAPRHFLDADHYGSNPFDSLPPLWEDAAKKYSEAMLNRHGIVPWHIQKMYYMLVKAFRNQDRARILKLSAELGHYIADAHVPLHLTQNYNGQLTGQTGIHAFWESRLPELFSSRYDYLVGSAKYIDNPLNEAWKIVKHTYSLTDSVLRIESALNKSFPSDRKYTFTQRNGRVTKQYSEEYALAYHDALKGMVERQMRASIAETGSYWYSAWVDAGQPDLKKLKAMPDSAGQKKQAGLEEQLYLKGNIIGRKEE